MPQKLILPINNAKLTASFKNDSYKKKFKFPHYGVDVISTVGSTTVYASGIGTVVAKGWDQNAGFVVVVKYPQAHHCPSNEYKDVIFRYYHLNSISENLPDAVNTNTILGQYGGSGFGSMKKWAPHLHVEADTDTAHPCYSPTFAVSGAVIKGTSAGSTDSTCVSPVEFLHCKPSSPDKQTYSTTEDAYINVSDGKLQIV